MRMSLTRERFGDRRDSQRACGFVQGPGMLTQVFDNDAERLFVLEAALRHADPNGTALPTHLGEAVKQAAEVAHAPDALDHLVGGDFLTVHLIEGGSAGAE